MLEKLFNRKNRPLLLFFVLLVGFFFLLPALTENFYLLSVFTIAYIYIIFATSWDVFAGYAHLMNFGHALFVGLAGYLTAFLDRFYGIPPIFALMFSASLCGLMGMLIGVITLRLRGPYFAMITISFAAVAHESSIMFSEVTGGEEGIPGLSSLTNSWTGDYYFVLAAMTAIFLLLLWFTRGRYGLLLKAISENEDAVLASGINTALIKTVTYTISGALCGVGGSLYAYVLMHVGPNSLEQILSTTILIMAIVGGMGTIIGPFVGALLLVILNELLRDFQEYRLLMYTVLVVVIIFFAPKGVVSYTRPIAEKVRVILRQK
ncbi:MAG: branched-chain amino acid ABC transporter permease [Desulfobacterales bacterium]|nr:branched-chain amino acid ABC transporter permease [Desulfobacterales bacterium]